jgi:branched-subunit amino acid transport protein
MTDAMAAIIGMALTVLLVRGIAFAFARRIVLPQIAREGLELAAPAIIAALLAMGLIFDKETGALDLSLGNDYLVGGLLAVLIAVWVRNFSAATALGFVAFLAIRALH